MQHMRQPKFLAILRPPINHATASQNNHIQNASLKRRLIRLYLTVILLLAMMLSVYIWQSTKMVEIKFRLKDLERSISSLETNNDVLRAEISKLQSLPRIEKIAREQLGMVIPSKICYLPMPEYLLVNRK